MSNFIYMITGRRDNHDTTRQTEHRMNTKDEDHYWVVTELDTGNKLYYASETAYIAIRSTYDPNIQHRADIVHIPPHSTTTAESSSPCSSAAVPPSFSNWADDIE